MKQHWCGLDWADRSHAVCVVDEAGGSVPGSVTRFDDPDLPTTDYSTPFPFYLVHVQDGFYALAWPDDLGGGYKHCDVTYDSGTNEFSCSNGARWALDGSVVTKPEGSLQDDPLEALVVRVSLDGHILVSPTTFAPNISLDLQVTDG